SLYALEALSSDEREGAYFGGSRTMISNFCPSSFNTRRYLFTSDCIAVCFAPSKLLSTIFCFSVSTANAELSTLVTSAAPVFKAFKVNPPEYEKQSSTRLPSAYPATILRFSRWSQKNPDFCPSAILI